MNNDLMFSSKSEMWETPQAFFDDLNNLFQFTLDACATPENAKCERYFTPEMDGLKQDWDGVVWCNPPIRTRRWGVGRESTSNRRGIRRNGCYAASGEDGYRLVPRLLLQRQICNHQFRAWEIKVRRRKEQCPIPKHGCDFSPPRESATLGRNVHEHRRTI